MSNTEKDNEKKNTKEIKENEQVDEVTNKEDKPEVQESKPTDQEEKPKAQEEKPQVQDDKPTVQEDQKESDEKEPTKEIDRPVEEKKKKDEEKKKSKEKKKVKKVKLAPKPSERKPFLLEEDAKNEQTAKRLTFKMDELTKKSIELDQWWIEIGLTSQEKQKQTPPSPTDLLTSLKDGKLLIKFARLLYDTVGSVKKILKEEDIPKVAELKFENEFHWRENIENFLKVCSKLGIEKEFLFVPNDIIEPSEMKAAKVVNTLLILKENYEKDFKDAAQKKKEEISKKEGETKDEKIDETKKADEKTPLLSNATKWSVIIAVAVIGLIIYLKKKQ